MGTGCKACPADFKALEASCGCTAQCDSKHKKTAGRYDGCNGCCDTYAGRTWLGSGIQLQNFQLTSLTSLLSVREFFLRLRTTQRMARGKKVNR